MQKLLKKVHLEEPKNVLLNAMDLCNTRNVIIKLFEEKNVSDYPYNAKLEKSESESESVLEFEDIIAERTKIRWQKNLIKKIKKDKDLNY